MMARRAAMLIFVAVLAAGGCMTPQAADLEYARAARLQVAQVIDGFTEAIRNKDSAAAMDYVDRGLSVRDTERIKRMLAQIVWVARYSGYRVNTQKAVSAASWRALEQGRASVAAHCTNAQGDRFREGYTFVRRDDDKWYVSSVQFLALSRSERADPPPGEVPGIRREVKFVVESLKAGHPGKVYAALPDEEDSRFRATPPYGLARVFGGAPARYSIYEDLQIMQEFEIPTWPDVDKELPLYFVAPTIIEARYNIPYTWAAGGIYRADTLRMRIVLVRSRGFWRLHKVRLYGQGIEGSL